MHHATGGLGSRAATSAQQHMHRDAACDQPTREVQCERGFPRASDRGITATKHRHRRSPAGSVHATRGDRGGRVRKRRQESRWDPVATPECRGFHCNGERSGKFPHGTKTAGPNIRPLVAEVVASQPRQGAPLPTAHQLQQSPRGVTRQIFRRLDRDPSAFPHPTPRGLIGQHRVNEPGQRRHVSASPPVRPRFTQQSDMIPEIVGKRTQPRLVARGAPVPTGSDRPPEGSGCAQ